jgi:putative ABC transport system substrate-binding protein
LTAFKRGLSEIGFEVDRNVAIEARYGDGQAGRVRGMVDELVQRRVAVIFAAGGSVVEAKAATTSIPIVFTTGADPVREGLVTSMNRPGGNITGVTFLTISLGPKRLQIIRELMPTANVIGHLAYPPYPYSQHDIDDLKKAARALGVRLETVAATNEREIDAAFVTFSERRISAMIVGAGPFFNSRRARITALAARHAIPAMYVFREFAEAGGLLTYGASITDAYRQCGIYVGRILKGEKPSDLPVLQATKIEMVINLKAAKALGLDFPLALLGRADDVIE